MPEQGCPSPVQDIVIQLTNGSSPLELTVLLPVGNDKSSYRNLGNWSISKRDDIARVRL